MEDNPPSFWWCCLYPSERSVMGAVAEGLLLTLYEGIPLALWDALWSVTLRGGDEYKQAFLQLYHLEIGTMLVDLVPIDAVVPVDGYALWWAGIVLWLLDPLSTCTEGCPQSQRPVM